MNFFSINSLINKNKRNSFYVKKAVGASQYQLLRESFFIATLQTAFMLLLVLFILTSLIQLSDSAREIILIQGSRDLLTAFSITLSATYITILLAHTLFLVTLTRPKNTYYSDMYTQQPRMRNLIFLLQVIVVGTIIYLWAGIMTQLHFMQNNNFGYEKKHYDICIN